MRANLYHPGLCLSFLFLLLAGSALAIPPPLPEFPPLKFYPPPVRREVLSNGMTIFFLEDHELPLIDISMRIRTGSQYEPADKIGLTSIFAEALRDGGTATRSPEEIRRALEQKAASIGFGVGTESADGSLSCRTQDLDQVLAIFADLLRNPRFEKSQVELHRQQLLESIRRRDDDPGETARRAFRKILYGSDHPYSRTPEIATAQRVTRRDLIEFHKAYFQPNAMWLAVSGDFKTEEMRGKLENVFGNWPQGSAAFPAVPKVQNKKERVVRYVYRGIPQSQVRVGHLGVARHHAEHFALEILNEIWGGEPGARLWRIVRTQKGLAYSIGSAISEPADLGMIVAGGQTKGLSTSDVIMSILEITRDLKEGHLTEQEVQQAKEAIINRFVSNFTSSHQIAVQRMELEYFGFPADYLNTYTTRVRAVTLADVKRAAAQHLDPDHAAILVVGDPNSFSKPLSAFGSVEEIKLETPK